MVGVYFIYSIISLIIDLFVLLINDLITYDNTKIYKYYESKSYLLMFNICKFNCLCT